MMGFKEQGKVKITCIHCRRCITLINPEPAHQLIVHKICKKCIDLAIANK